MPGLLITFEGIEGSGKSTLAKFLYDYLKSKGINCVLTKEPGGTRLTQKIRELILDVHNQMNPLTELFLYLADRAQHVEEIIKPALKENKVVISDRYSDATIAYQGGGRHLPKGTLKELNKIATSGITPDLTILLDVPPDKALKRIRQKDRIESENIEFHRAVRVEYLRLAKESPGRIKILDASKSLDELKKEVISIVEEFLKNHGYKV